MNSIKKPPDKYKCIKLPFKSLLYDNQDYTLIFDNILSIHKITIKIYQLLRLYFLYCFDNYNKLPKLDKVLLRKVKNVIIKKFTKKNLEDKTFLVLKDLYDEPFEKEPKCACFIFEEVFTTIIVSYENNIKNHYFEYVKRFINSFFKDCDKKELFILKNDIIHNTNKTTIYNEWLNEFRNKIIPVCDNEDDKYFHYKNIKDNCYDYLKCMIFMNKELEKSDGKMFQCLPLRNDCIPKSIVIDTSTLNNLFENGKYQKDLVSMKTILWNKYFKIPIKKKNYIFDNTIITDGVSVSLRMIYKDDYEKNILTNAKKTAGRKRGSEENKKLKELKIEKENKLKSLVNKINNKLKGHKITTKKEKELMFNEDNKKIVFEQKIINEKCPYIEDVDKDLLLNKKRVFIDPGKNTLLQMMMVIF
jgi:hypothetical protein